MKLWHSQVACWARSTLSKFPLLLHSLRARTILVYVHIFAFNIYGRLRHTYENKYKLTTTHGQRTHSAGANKESGPDDEVNSNRLRRAYDWQWRDLPTMPSVLIWYRNMSTLYYVYVLFKYLAPSLAKRVVVLLGRSKPAHCYFVGQFIVYDRPLGTCGAVFACIHLVSRLFLTTMFSRPLALPTFYFLMLDDKDIQLYCNLLDGSQSCRAGRRVRPLARNSNWGPTISPTSDAHLMMMHDIMSFPVVQAGTGVRVFRLRPSRTLQASDNLRHYLVRLMLYGTMFFAIGVIFITTMTIVAAINDQSYLIRYPDCDPYLEQLKRNEVHAWDRVAPHLVVALLFDIVENWIIWFNSGIALYSGITCAMLLNRDLIAYWTEIGRKIDTLLELSRQSSEMSGARPYDDESIYELQLEICDFVKSFKRSDMLVGDIITILITTWLATFSYFIYNLVLAHTPTTIAFNLTLLVVFMSATILNIIATFVHRNCLHSYEKICSLMALDRSHYKRNFTEILDFFVSRRTCYTIYRTYAMTTTSYLTMLGYTVSCFFILGSIHKR
jgi:hypothetical protein